MLAECGMSVHPPAAERDEGDYGMYGSGPHLLSFSVSEQPDLERGTLSFPAVPPLACGSVQTSANAPSC